MTPPRIKQKPSVLTLLWQRSLKFGWTVYGSRSEGQRNRQEEMFHLEWCPKGRNEKLPLQKKKIIPSPCPVLFFLPLKSFPQELTIGKTDAALNIQASYLSNFSADIHMSLFTHQLIQVQEIRCTMVLKQLISLIFPNHIDT